MFNDHFISEIPEELNTGAKYIIDSFSDFYDNDDENVNSHNDYVEYYILLEAFLNSKDFVFTPVIIDSEKTKNIDRIIEFFIVQNKFFTEKLSDESINNSKERYRNIFNKSFMYEFTDGDLDRVQTLINELRDIISKSELFEAKHQARLLRRLERLQGELHKKVSDLDRFWGLIGDAGVAIGKFGKDVKPIVDRIREITQIVWNTQAKSEELPSGTSIPKITDENNN